MSDLRNGAATRWDWDRILRLNVGGSPFPRGISHGDVDSEIELKGRFLVTEGKRPHETLSAGQRYTMNARVRDGRTCVVVYGNPEAGTIDFLQVWPHEPMEATWDDYHRLCSEWSAWTDANGRAQPRESNFTPSFVRDRVAA